MHAVEVRSCRRSAFVPSKCVHAVFNGVHAVEVRACRRSAFPNEDQGRLGPPLDGGWYRRRGAACQRHLQRGLLRVLNVEKQTSGSKRLRRDACRPRIRPFSGLSNPAAANPFDVAGPHLVEKGVNSAAECVLDAAPRETFNARKGGPSNTSRGPASIHGRAVPQKGASSLQTASLPQLGKKMAPKRCFEYERDASKKGAARPRRAPAFAPLSSSTRRRRSCRGRRRAPAPRRAGRRGGRRPSPKPCRPSLLGSATSFSDGARLPGVSKGPSGGVPFRFGAKTRQSQSPAAQARQGHSRGAHGTVLQLPRPVSTDRLNGPSTGALIAAEKVRGA
ncbi:hypothetical protein M885DRAFT_258276 [Pelagophyceae sp. CCMP2097]|nr:hypothetical protein M885DRAFT_258276 [Pelagophyceae sp. CCMP2097]